MPFVQRMLLDVETGERVTANPLMLSMVASVFEIRKGVDMPNTIAKLYESASEAMLARGGVLSTNMRTLLEAALFEAMVSSSPLSALLVHRARTDVALRQRLLTPWLTPGGE